MITFYSALVVLVAIPVLMILPALRNKRPLRVGDRKTQNAEIAKQRLDEINQLQNNNVVLEQANKELHATLLEDIKNSEATPSTYIDSRYGLLIALIIPVVGFSIYHLLGNPEFASSDRDLVAESRSTDAVGTDINVLLQQLQARIEKDPNNADGWALAARTNMRLQNYAEAERAYARLNELVVGNADHLAEWADATIMAANNIFTPEAKLRVEKALSINPINTNALWIAGLGAGSIGKHEDALAYFERLSPLFKDDQNTTNQINRLVQHHRQQLGNPITQGKSDQEGDHTPKQYAKTINIIASIATELNDIVSPNDTVFIVAKAKSGPRAPLAVSRHLVKDLPVTVALTKDMAMLPSMTIENYGDIQITARISKSGNAIAQTGDFSSQLELVTLDNINNQFTLVINKTESE